MTGATIPLKLVRLLLAFEKNEKSGDTQLSLRLSIKKLTCRSVPQMISPASSEFIVKTVIKSPPKAMGKNECPICYAITDELTREVYVRGLIIYKKLDIVKHAEQGKCRFFTLCSPFLTHRFK